MKFFIRNWNHVKLLAIFNLYLFYLEFFTSIKLTTKKKQLVEIIPDDIVYPEPIKFFPEREIYDMQKYNFELHQNKIGLEDESRKYNGKIYYKDPQQYYGPQETYRNIPDPEPDKFYTPIQLMPIEILRNETDVKNAIFETEREIVNKILFTPAPKNHGKNSIKENYPLPYYDSTYFSKVTQISQLKNKAQFLKNQLEEMAENHLEQSSSIPMPSYNRTVSNPYFASQIYGNITNNNLNLRINSDLNSQNPGVSNLSNEAAHKPKISGEYSRSKNNDLHLFVIINNDTFPHKLADMESKLAQNSHNYTEKSFGYEDLIKEQLQSVDNVYAKRKDQLASFNNEMKNNLKDVHDKKFLSGILEIKNTNDYTNPNKSKENIKIDPAAKINLGIVNPNLTKKEESLVSNSLGNDDDFLKNLDKNLLKSLQSELINEVKGSNSKSLLLGEKPNSAPGNKNNSDKDGKLKLDEEDSDFDFL